MMAKFLTLLILGTTLGLFTVLPTTSTVKNTSEESIFGKNESLELTVKLERGDELRLKATGATTMDLVQSLNRMLRNTEKNHLEGLY